jgi:rod shape-determining protein MreC
VALALVLTVWQHRAQSRPADGDGHARTSAPERLAVALSWPLQAFFSGLGTGLHDTGSGLGQYRRLSAENQRLRAEKDELEAQKLILTAAAAENQELKRTLGLSEGTPGEPLLARVVAMNYLLSSKRLTILAPRGRTLEVGNIVVASSPWRTDGALVGRVTEVLGNGSRAYVFPLIDGEHAVAGVIQRSRDQGMIHAAALPDYMPDMLVMDKVLGRADIRENDVVLTSGLGEVYPAGIPVGQVVRLQHFAAGSMGLTAIIRPFVDFDHLTYVLVKRYGN